MQAQRNAPTSKKIWQLALGLGLVIFVVWARALLWQAALQLFYGLMLSLLAMPIMRRLEKKLSVPLSASLSLFALSAIFFGALLLLIPLVIEQVRQLMGVLPTLYGGISEWMQTFEEWLIQSGINIPTDLRASIMQDGEKMISGLLPATIEKVGGIAGSLGKVLLAPAFAFYFLRDRKRISGTLLLCFPVSWRDTVVKTLREMRRETAGFLRGQLMVSAVVGVFTGVGLLIVGIPAWLLLGMLMGILELIPYVGPFIGGIFVLLFALQGGMSSALWALGIVLLVQQLEGSVLSPQMMSDATRLHPVAVLLSVMLGGMAGGMMGIVLAIPFLLCARATLRVISLKTMSLGTTAAGNFDEKKQNAKQIR
jgi:predicted PurR-regulated permease PerM